MFFFCFCFCLIVFLVKMSRMFIKRLQTCLWGVHYMGYSVCMHIINTCAAWQRCESESFSTKWSASRERNKEICSCQGSVRQRLLLEIFWKNHTFEGLVLCCLRISSSDQWNHKKRGEHGLENSDVGMDTGRVLFGRQETSLFTWSFRGRRRVFVLTLKHVSHN